MRWGTSFILLCISLPLLFAQPDRDWDTTLGSTDWDELHKVIHLSTGELLLAGNIAGFEGSISDTIFGKNDFWVQKTNAIGNPIWEKTFGGTGDDKLWSLLALDNGNILLAGSSDSDINGNKTSQAFGGIDYWIVMLDENGDKLWEKTYGSTGDDRLFDIAEHRDGGFVLAGFSDGNASGVKVSNSFGESDLWVLHIDDMGNLLWQSQIGGDKTENVYQIEALQGGSFLLAGATSSARNNSVSQVGFGEMDMWLIKIDKNGKKLWDQRYGGKKSEQAYTILPLRDGHFLLGGASESAPHGKKLSNNFGNNDFWAIKVTPNGQMIWENSFGGSGLDVLYDAVEGEDGSLYIAGVSDSEKSGNKVTEPLGGYDYWLLKCSNTGEKIWDATYGGNKNDALTQLRLMDDGSLLLAGHSESNISTHKSQASYGLNDIWIFKSFCSGDIELPADKAFCKNTEQTISAWTACQNDCNILWQNGAQTGFEYTFFVQEDTQINAQVFDKYGCTVRDTFTYSVLPNLDVNLGPIDTFAHEKATVVLNAPTLNASTWAWSNDDSKAFTRIEESGTYSVTVTDADGCTGTDEINVCLCLKDEVYIPNVFNPENSSDYRNQYWYVQAKPGILHSVDFIELYAPQGHLVYKTQSATFGNPLDGWNGRSEAGQKLNPGVYTYRIGLNFESGFDEVRFGTVTLVR